MPKKILLPTDLSIDSLNVLKLFLHDSAQDEQFDIVLTYGHSLSDGINDLLFFSKQKVLKELKPTHFEEALNIIQNKYSRKISSVQIDLFTGYNHSAFENYLTGQRITEIVYSDDISFKPYNRKNFNLLRFIQKAPVPCKKIDCKLAEIPANTESTDISVLFNTVALSS